MSPCSWTLQARPKRLAPAFQAPLRDKKKPTDPNPWASCLTQFEKKNPGEISRYGWMFTSVLRTASGALTTVRLTGAGSLTG